MLSNDERLFSVRTGAKLIGCSVSTLQRDIATGVLTPINPAPRRDPRGSRLDFSDLVLARGFRVLGAAGVTLSNLDIFSEMFAEALRTSLGNYSNMIRGLNAQLESSAAHKRIFQWFFRNFEYDVYLVARAVIKKDQPVEWIVTPVWSAILQSWLQNGLRSGNPDIYGGNAIVMADIKALAEMVQRSCAESE